MNESDERQLLNEAIQALKSEGSNLGNKLKGMLHMEMIYRQLAIMASEKGYSGRKLYSV